MKLEEIAKTYGMFDYMDTPGGRIFQLSMSVDDGKGNLIVPVVSIPEGRFLGYAKMRKPE